MVRKFKFLLRKQILTTKSGILTTPPVRLNTMAVLWGRKVEKCPDHCPAGKGKAGWPKSHLLVSLSCNRAFLLVFSPVAAILNTILTLISIRTQYYSWLRCLHSSLAPCHTVYTHIRVLAHAMHSRPPKACLLQLSSARFCTEHYSNKLVAIKWAIAQVGTSCSRWMTIFWNSFGSMRTSYCLKGSMHNTT